jgi:phage/plasmid-associated DNA primase
MYARYKIQADKRGLSFNLSKDDFSKLIRMDCHYCGAKPKQLRFTDRVSAIFTGIDRMNNSEGYELSNVVSCCSLCNFMKVKLSHDEFIAQCKRIAKFTDRGL